MNHQSMEMEAEREFSRQNGNPNDETIFQRRRSCCGFPCFDGFGGDTSPSQAGRLTWWQKIRSSEIGSENSLWTLGVSALKKIREWSEIVAGPRWKTFIRRFNRRHVSFQYDPLSYTMNFDNGQGQNGQFEEEEEDDDGSGYHNRQYFSTRYANSSVDLDNDGPQFI